MHTPGEAAKLLGIAAPTLRKWSSDLAKLLSPSARRPGARGRRYTDADMALLRRYQALLLDGSTYEQARALLAGGETEGPAVEGQPLAGLVEVLQPSDQQQALVQLVEAQRQIVEAQRALIAQQGEQLAAAQQVAEIQRAQLDALERGLAAAHQQLDDTRADLVGQLAEARARWARLPRWVRWLFGGEG